MERFIESEKVNVIAFPRKFLGYIRPLLINEGIDFKQKGHRDLGAEEEKPILTWEGQVLDEVPSYFYVKADIESFKNYVEAAVIKRMQSYGRKPLEVLRVHNDPTLS